MSDDHERSTGGILSGDKSTSTAVDRANSAVLPEGGVTSQHDVEQDYEKHERDKSGVRSMVLNMGPQHPSTHGVLRLLLELDGETILKAAPDIGYLHTGIEKEFEVKHYQQGVTLTDQIGRAHV